MTECPYCMGYRCPCNCDKDCGARPAKYTGAYCPYGEGYIDYLRRTNLFSEDELRKMAERYG